MISNKVQSIIAMESEGQQRKTGCITKAYYRLFYFFFRMGKRKHSSDKIATYCALLPLVLFGYIDLMILECFFSRFVYDLNVSHSVVYPIVLALISVIFNMIVLYHNQKYLAIREMFSTEDYDTRFKRSLLCILYSLITLFGSVILIDILRLP